MQIGVFFSRKKQNDIRFSTSDFITDMAGVHMESCEDQAKAYLTLWLIEQRESGIVCPETTMARVQEAKSQQLNVLTGF